MDEVNVQSDFRTRLSAMAREAGFDVAGIAGLPAGSEDAQEQYLEAWIGAGFAGEMDYLKRRDEEGTLLRASVQDAFPWAKSVILCAVNYNTHAPRSIDPAPAGAGWIARYAWSGTREQPADYHDLVLHRLRVLEGALRDWLGFEQSRSYVDTGPIVERVYARLAGLGWTGKNTCLIREGLGSWLFLGVIVTSYEPRLPVVELPPDRCGTCRRCIEACPTDALIAPYTMDASRCISYLTIEKRGSISEALRPKMGRQVFGCDICQDVCPWNRKAPESADDLLSGRTELINPDLAMLAELDRKEFNRWFKGSPIKRAKYEGFRRNLAIAMGNDGSAGFLEKLTEWALEDDAVLSESAEWAVERIRGGQQ